LGTVYNALGAYPQAARALERAVHLQPAMLSAYSTLAVVYSKQGKIAQALSQFQTAFALGSDSVQMENDYGALLVNLGRLREGIEHLQRAVEMASERGEDWALPRANLAIAYLDLNEFALAEQQVLEALKLAPRSAPVRTIAARVFMAQRRYQRALAELREALHIDRDYALARVKLSNLYHLLQQDREAYKEMLRAGLTDAGALVEERLYSRTEMEVAAGSTHAFLKTDGRSAGGQVAYYLSAAETEEPSWLPNGDWTDRAAQLLAGRYNSDGSRDFLRATYSATTSGRPGSVLEPDRDYRYRAFETSFDFARQFPATRAGRFFLLAHYDRVAERANNPDSMAATTAGEMDTKPYLWRQADMTRYGAEMAWMGRLGEWEVTAGAAGQWGTDRASGLLWQVRVDPLIASPIADHFPFTTKDYRDLGTGYVNLCKRLGEDWLEIGGQVVASDGTSPSWRPRLVWEHTIAPDKRLWLGTYTVAREDVGLLSPTNPWRPEHELEWTNLAPGGFGQFYEGRYELLSARSMLGLVLFYRDYEGLLAPLADPQLDGEPPYLLVDDGRAYGGQVTFERALSPALTLSGQVTYADGRDEGRGQQNPFMPDWRGRLAVHYKDPNGWRMEALWRYTGSRSDAVGASVGGFGVFDLYLSRQFSPQLEVFVSGTNVFDREYQYWPGYVRLGRHVTGGVRYRF
ncbi:MAG: TonB-dependent receptor, partial [Armatimonadetes bacterium]|nr:TonB-dependent receptor [Armatimonadota bacterium]